VSIRERRRTEQLNIRVTPEERAEIQAEAERRSVTVTDLIVKATLNDIRYGGRPFKGTLRRLREAGQT
jgi:hypothetical protein